MDNSKNVPSDNQNENLVSPSPPPSASYLTRDQEHEIMVLSLRQVISNTGGDTPSSSSISDNVLPPLDAGPCILCGVIGCYGCAFQQRHKENQEIKKEKKHKGVRKRPSGKWSAEIWDPSLKMRKWLGTFPTMEMAVHAYDEAAAELVGRISTRDGKKNGE